VSSGVSVDNAAPQGNLSPTNSSADTAKPSLCRLFWNSLRFYHRLLSVFFSHDPKLGRPFKALNLASQLCLMAAEICYIVAAAE